jgi:hypothetical protein
VTRHRARTVPALALALTAVLAGCSKPDTSPVPNTVPTPDPSAAPTRSLPPATRKWSGFSTKCPNLEGPTARTLGVAGDGRPTPDYVTSGDDVTVDCRWGSDDGKGRAVTLRMSIYQSQPAADAAWRVLSAGQTTAVSGLGDEAFSSLEPPDIAVRVRSNNVVATVRLVLPSTSATPERLRTERPSAAEIASDILHDLR